MKIQVVTYEYPPRIGGAGMVADDIARSFCKYGHEVQLITVYNASFSQMISNVIKTEVVDSVEIIKLPIYFNLWFLSFPLALKRLGAKFFNGRIILNDFGASYSFVNAFGYSRHKYFSYVHGKESFLINKKFIQNKIFRFKSIYKKILFNSKCNICVSDFIKNFVQSIPEVSGNFTVVNNAVDVEEFYFVNRINIPQDLMLKPESSSFRLVTACRFVEGKGFDRMLDIFSELTEKQNFDISWYIIGDGEYKTSFQKKIADRKIKGIHLLGRVKRSDLKYYYSQCNVFWLLSSYEEAYPLVYHEAQACNLPVIGLNRGGVKEVIDERYGFVVNNKSQAVKVIVNLLNNKINLQSWDSKEHDISSLYYKLHKIINN